MTYLENIAAAKEVFETNPALSNFYLYCAMAYATTKEESALIRQIIEENDKLAKQLNKG